MRLARAALLALTLLAALASPAGATYQCFTKPNAAAAAFPAQARLFEQDFQTLALGLRGTGVVYAAGACQVTQRAAGANMSVDVTNGCTIAVEGATASVTSGNAVIGAAHASLPRFDLVGATSAGVKTITAGTAAASPLPPTIPDNHVPFAWVYVPAADGSITTNQITDARACIPTPGAGSGAGTGLSYITKVAEGTLSNEFALGTLPTAVLINTTTTGIPTTLAAQVCTNQFVRSYTAAATATCSAVALGADVSGDLPFANLTPATAASKLFGRGSAGGAGDWQEIAIGSGLTMTTTTLSASGGGSGPTITTFATSGLSDVSATLTVNSLTVRSVHYFTLPGEITLNQLSLSPDTVTTNGALKLCIYSADGATKLVDITTGAPVSNTTLSTSVGSIVLPAGEYYAVEGCQSTCNLGVRAVPAETGSAAMFGAGSPSGKKKWHGTVTHTSGTCNTTLGTITGTATVYPVLRGDN